MGYGGWQVRGLLIYWAFLAVSSNAQSFTTLHIPTAGFPEAALGAISYWSPDDKLLSIYGHNINMSGFFDVRELKATVEAVRSCYSTDNKRCHIVECPGSDSAFILIKRFDDDENLLDACAITAVNMPESSIEIGTHTVPIPRPVRFVECLVHGLRKCADGSMVKIIFGAFSTTIGRETNVKDLRIEPAGNNTDAWSNYNHVSADTSLVRAGSSGEGRGIDILYNPSVSEFYQGPNIWYGSIDRIVRRDESILSIGNSASESWRIRILKVIDDIIGKYNQWLSIERPDREAVSRASEDLRRKLYAVTHQKEAQDIRSPFGVNADPFDSIRDSTKTLRDRVNAQAKAIITDNPGLQSGLSQLIAGSIIVGFVAYLKHGPPIGAAAGVAFFTMLEPASVSTTLIGVIVGSIYFFRRYPIMCGAGLIYGFGLYEGLFK